MHHAAAAAARHEQLDVAAGALRERLARRLAVGGLLPDHDAPRQLRATQVVLDDHLPHQLGVLDRTGTLENARLFADHAPAAHDERRHGGAIRMA